jgi:hypothetical protein
LARDLRRQALGACLLLAAALAPMAHAEDARLALELGYQARAFTDRGVTTDDRWQQGVRLRLQADGASADGQWQWRADLRARADDDLVLEVEDTGPGMTPDEVTRLFDAFTQGDESSTRTAEGLGLGDESAPAGDATRTVEPSRATAANVVTSARGKERTPQE